MLRSGPGGVQGGRGGFPPNLSNLSNLSNHSFPRFLDLGPKTWENYGCSGYSGLGRVRSGGVWGRLGFHPDLSNLRNLSNLSFSKVLGPRGPRTHPPPPNESKKLPCGAFRKKTFTTKAKGNLLSLRFPGGSRKRRGAFWRPLGATWRAREARKWPKDAGKEAELVETLVSEAGK